MYVQVFQYLVNESITWGNFCEQMTLMNVRKLEARVKITHHTDIEMLNSVKAETQQIEIFNTSSCLLVIGTFQTGYCRVYTDRKLPARGV